ncbi:MAG: cation:proton antiporter [Thermodesulfobacteriota bacterium]|nr:cation:proton antiporter [Thermodesulfobacteriota bacterium]
MNEHLIIQVLLILGLAWILGTVFIKLELPPMLGELTAGLILGPPLFGIVQPSETLEFLAEMGIFFAMFYAGMEMDPKNLIKNLFPSVVVALGGFFIPFILGYFVCKAFGGTLYQSLFVGMGLSITAIAVQAVILQSLQIHKTNIGNIIMGAAIVDDILSLCTLSILLGLAKSGTVDVTSVAIIIGKVVLFFGVTISIGHFIMPHLTRRLNDYHGKGFTFAMVSALVMAYMAELAGLHLVIGAFLAGQFVRKETMNEKVYDAISDRFYGISYGFLTPIFFATLAFHLHISWDLSFLFFVATLILVAIFGKVFGCAGAARLVGQAPKESLLIGLGMNGRGAVELVVATVVIKLSNELLQKNIIDEPLLTDHQFSALVLMAFITTLLTPILLKRSVVRSCAVDSKEEFCRIIKETKTKILR